MIYFLIVLFQTLGIGFHVAQKIVSLGDKFPAKDGVSNKGQIFKVFWSEDWDTLLVSTLILVLDVAVHFTIFDYLRLTTPSDWYWQIMPFAVALILGYAGQRLVYKWFGSAEQFLDKQVTDRLS